MQLKLNGDDAKKVVQNPLPLLQAAGVEGSALTKSLLVFSSFEGYRTESMIRMANADSAEERRAKATLVRTLGNTFIKAYDDKLGVGHHQMYPHYIAAGHVADEIGRHGNRVDGSEQTLERRNQLFKGHRNTNSAVPRETEEEDGTVTIIPARCVPRIAQVLAHIAQERFLRLNPEAIPVKPNAHLTRKRKAVLALLTASAGQGQSA